MNRTFPSHRLSFEEFYSLTENCAREGSCSGNEQSSERITATRLNLQRMKRISQQFVPDSGITALLTKTQPVWEWWVIAETWCGDGAQTIPLIASIARLSPGISLHIILRDKNPSIMDNYLTNGNRAIPKLICIDKKTGSELGTWGPRPGAIDAAIKELKTARPGILKADLHAELHLRYARDKGLSFVKDMMDLLPRWIATSA